MNSWLTLLLKLLLLNTVISENVKGNGNITVNEFPDENEGSRTLSRRKRFILFPEGSSFQLVFCAQQAALIPIGDIFLFGSTIALAWALPSDPKLFYMLKEYERPLRRSDVKKTINYFDEDGKIIARVPYKRRLIVNPAFAKRSVDDNELTFKEKLKIKIDRQKMHERQMNRDYLKTEYMDKDAIEFHRSNRLELYQKVEAFVSGLKHPLYNISKTVQAFLSSVYNLCRLGRDGRQCVLYRLCEAAQRRQGQGTFLEEFLAVVFTLPKGEEFELDEHKEYDAAHTPTEDCRTRYPGCFENQI